MRAEEPHRLAGRGAHRRQAEPLDQAVEDGVGRLARLDDAGGDAERPGRGRDQEGVRLHVGARPVAGRELVLDQAVGGGGVGHAQQRLGQHHQGEALLGGERIGMQEILDAAEPAGPAADAFDQPGGTGVDPRFGRGRPRRLSQECGRDRLVRRRIGRDNGRLGTVGGYRRSSEAPIRPARGSAGKFPVIRTIGAGRGVRNCVKERRLTILPCSLHHHVLC